MEGCRDNSGENYDDEQENTNDDKDSGSQEDGGTETGADTDVDASTDTETQCVDSQPGPPLIISDLEVTVHSTTDSYTLVFNEEVLNVDLSGTDHISWMGPVTPPSSLASIVTENGFIFTLTFTGLVVDKDYFILVGGGITDLCGTPLDVPFPPSGSIIIQITYDPL